MPTTFKEFVMPYTVLMRQMLSADMLPENAIDSLTEDALGLLKKLPPFLQFDPATWIQDDFSGPPWPANMLAMILGLNIVGEGDYPEIESDKEELRKSYLRFQDEAYLGIHELAAIAVEHLGRMFHRVGIPMEGIEYKDGSNSNSNAGSINSDMMLGQTSENNSSGIPQTFGYGLRIPDTLFKNGDMCDNAWQRL
ncbi:hypothetical protein ABW20_dc0107478 [Dactylellina cionopaga]|nr:hypothetical protein ABW20_dc0107478 [Dactylellina cionopaga]